MDFTTVANNAAIVQLGVKQTCATFGCRNVHIFPRIVGRNSCTGEL